MFAKIIQGVLKGIGLVTGFLPLFQQAFPTAAGNTNVATITDDLTKAAAAVQTAAVVVSKLQGAGSDPSMIIAAAEPLIAQVIQQAEFVSGHKITNEAQFTGGCQKIAEGLHDVLVSLGE